MKIKLGTRLYSPKDIPQPLYSQIPEFKIKTLEQQILDVLTNELEGIGTLSEIMIAVYNKYNVCDKDRACYIKHIYRLIRQHLLEKVKNRKGIYKISSLESKCDIK